MSDKSFGSKPTLINAGDTIVGNFYLIKALEDSTVTVKTTWSRAAETETIDIVAQGTLEQLTEITVDSGKVLGFRE
jgi:hypothetical protein